MYTVTCDLPQTVINIHQAGFKQNLNFQTEFKFHYILESFTPCKHEKRIWKDSKGQTWKISSGMFLPIWSLLCAVCTSKDHHHYIVLFCDWSTHRILLPKPSCGIIFSATNSIEIDFTSIESLKTMNFHLSRLLMRMIDRSGHPNEKHIVKLKHCSLTKNGCYTRCRNTWDALLKQQDSSLPLIWLRNSHWKTIDDRNFLPSKMTVASSTALFETTSTSFFPNIFISTAR